MGREMRRLRRQAHRDDHLAGLQHALVLRRVARQPVKLFERDLPSPRFAFDLDNSVERDERHAEIRRMCRDAALAPPQYGVKPVLAAAGVTARTGIALIAGTGDVVEVSATRSLQEIAADRGGVAKLRGRSGQKRLGDRRKAPGKIPVVSKVGVADQRADPHAAVGKVLDAVEAGKMADVDKPARTDDAALHQVQEVGAGGQIGGARFRRGGNGFLHRCRPAHSRRSSCDFPSACRTKRLLSLQHRLGDSLIGAAAAEISAHAFAHALRIVAGLDLPGSDRSRS